MPKKKGPGKKATRNKAAKQPNLPPALKKALAALPPAAVDYQKKVLANQTPFTIL